ncbi:retrovirus-related Pol polyprotein from transposon gypsy [Trichonephila clavipes]|nr:retrovirus-related Pol polyprotein from transposon gypsy [Trichonephila clavipes]
MKITPLKVLRIDADKILRLSVAFQFTECPGTGLQKVSVGVGRRERGIKTITEENKLPLLCNYVTSNVYQFINDCTTYAQAIAILDSLFIKKRNVIFARHCLSTRNQQTEETVSEYLQILNQLSKDCDFTDVKAEEYQKEYIRDAFIRGLKCPRIRLRLLENTSMTLDQAFEQARTLESAEVHAASYMGSSFPVQSATMKTEDFSEETVATSAASSSSSRSQKCFFCGNDLHSRTLCPARDVICRNCGKKGHYQGVCKSRPGRNSSNVVASSNTLVAISGSTHCLQKSIIKALVNNIQLSALIDTESSLSFLNEKHVAKCKLKVEPYLGKISMANSSMVTETEGVCKVNLKIENFTYQNVELLVMKDLCSDVLIVHDILNRHSSVEIGFDGNRPPLTICSLAVAQVPPVSLFSNLNPDCRSLVTKPRRQTVEENIFIALEVQKLLQEGVIEPSNSPWRAQAFVIRGENHKPRIVVDYSQTINKYTLLDSYPLPKIEEVILKISKNKVFSKIDLQSAYHQIPIQDSERHYTAFEACGKLYQFLRAPFGVTNGVAYFQRVIDKIIEDDEGLTLTYPFIDDLTVCGKDQKEHDDNLEKFMTVAKNQAGRPVAFFSRTRYASELRHSSPEKEAYATVESLRHWRHFLMGKHFEVFTDQQAVAFVFNQRHGSKIKNEKLIRWRLELASFKFDIIYRPGKQKVIADALSRITGAITPRVDLYNLHNSLCHPGETRMHHWELQQVVLLPIIQQEMDRLNDYNGIIWKTIQLALRSNSLKTEQWEGVIQTALHSIRSLLCTATNATPHERVFSHPRRSHNGCSIPTWLTKPGPVLMKNQMRANKYEPIVQEVELIEANPDYVRVKLGDGRETTVSIRHLAPRGETTRSEDNKGAEENVQAYPDLQPINSDSAITLEDSTEQNMNTVALRTTSRHRQPPAYLKDYIRD